MIYREVNGYTKNKKTRRKEGEPEISSGEELQALLGNTLWISFLVTTYKCYHCATKGTGRPDPLITLRNP